MRIKNRQYSSGFTIVELLIVIVVIAILAAITIVAYQGVTQNARISSIKADLKQAYSKLEYIKVDQSTYPTTLDPSIKASGGNTYTYQYVAATN